MVAQSRRLWNEALARSVAEPTVACSSRAAPKDEPSMSAKKNTTRPTKEPMKRYPTTKACPFPGVNFVEPRGERLRRH